MRNLFNLNSIEVERLSFKQKHFFYNAENICNSFVYNKMENIMEKLIRLVVIMSATVCHTQETPIPKKTIRLRHCTIIHSWECAENSKWKVTKTKVAINKCDLFSLDFSVSIFHLHSSWVCPSVQLSI